MTPVGQALEGAVRIQGRVPPVDELLLAVGQRDPVRLEARARAIDVRHHRARHAAVAQRIGGAGLGQVTAVTAVTAVADLRADAGLVARPCTTRWLRAQRRGWRELRDRSARETLDSPDHLEDGREAAEANLVSVAELTLAVEADVLFVHERAVRRARVLDLNGACGRVDDDGRVT